MQRGRLARRAAKGRWADTVVAECIALTRRQADAIVGRDPALSCAVGAVVTAAGLGGLAFVAVSIQAA